jgi:NAD(P)-dependent dehydrogenase (short-subunit alcohol dehydrogenase family)
LEALVREIEGAGGDAIHNSTNVAKREDVAALTALACDRYGKLDVFISNAGIGPISKLELLFTPLGEPPQLIRRAGSGASAVAAHASRIPAGTNPGDMPVTRYYRSHRRIEAIDQKSGHAMVVRDGGIGSSRFYGLMYLPPLTLIVCLPW